MVKTYHCMVLSMMAVTIMGNGDPAKERTETLMPDQDGRLELKGVTINVESLPINSLKILELKRSRLIWDSSKSSISLNTLQVFEIYLSYLNPNSITFSSSLHTALVYGPKFVNGTLKNLLRTATNLHTLELSYIDEIVDVCHVCFNHVKIITVSYAELSCENRPTVQIGEKLLKSNIGSPNFKNLTLKEVRFKETKIQIHMVSLESITLKNMELHPSVLSISGTLTYCEISEIKVDELSTIEYWLKPAVNLKELSVHHTSEVDICKLHLNTLEILTAENTHLKCNDLKNVVQSSISLQRLTLINSTTSWNTMMVMEELEYLHLRNGELNPNMIKFGEVLSTIRLDSVAFNGSLDDLLSGVTRLQKLFINNINMVTDICGLPFRTLEYLTITHSPLRCANVNVFDSMKNFSILELNLTSVRMESAVPQLEILLQKSNNLSVLEIDEVISIIDLCRLPLSSLKLLNIANSTLICSNTSMAKSLQNLPLEYLTLKNVMFGWNESPTAHFKNLKNLSIEQTMLDTNIFKVGSKLNSLKLSFTEFDNNKTEDLLSLVPNLQVLHIQSMEPSMDICNPAFQNLIDLKIEDTNIVCGNNVGMYSKIIDHKSVELQDWLLTRNHSWYFKHLNSLHIERSMLDLPATSFGSNLKLVIFEEVEFQKEEYLSEIVQDVLELRYQYSTVDICRLPFRPISLLILKESDIICSNNSINLLQELEELRLLNVICTSSTHESFIHLVNLKNILIYGGELHNTLFKFSGKLRIADINSYTAFNTSPNQDINQFLKTATNLAYLSVDDSNAMLDVCLLPEKSMLEIIVFSGITCSNPDIIFEKLELIQPISIIPKLNLNGANLSYIFPALKQVWGEGAQFEISKPNFILDLLSIKSLKIISFTFDFDPPIKSFQFGKVMKIFENAGVLNQSSVFATDNNTIRRRIRYVKLIKLNGRLESGGIIELRDDPGPSKKVKPTETKIFFFVYFTILYLVIVIGILGNLLNGVILSRRKMKSSSVFVLLGLVFFDSGYILTYLLISIYNLKTIIKYFLQTEIKNYELTEYTEHDWTGEHEDIRTFILYPLNKTFYTGSVYTTILISVERFISVMRPLKSMNLLRARNTKFALFAILLFSIILNLPRWVESVEWNWYSEESQYWNNYYKPTLMRMDFYTPVYHGWIWVTFMYILPFVLVGGANFKIWEQIQLARKKRQGLTNSTMRKNQNSLNDDDDILALTKMLTCVVAVFVICNIIHISIICYYFLSKEEFELSNIEAVSGLPLLVNSSVNFIIYTVLGKTFRSEMLAMMPRICRTWILERSNSNPAQSSSTEAATQCTTQTTNL